MLKINKIKVGKWITDGKYRYQIVDIWWVNPKEPEPFEILISGYGKNVKIKVKDIIEKKMWVE